jgi:hypothetical protein
MMSLEAVIGLGVSTNILETLFIYQGLGRSFGDCGTVLLLSHMTWSAASTV